MSWRRVGQIIAELSVCAVHPVPGSFYFTWTEIHADGETVTSVLVSMTSYFPLSLPRVFAELFIDQKVNMSLSVHDVKHLALSVCGGGGVVVPSTRR